MTILAMHFDFPRFIVLSQQFMVLGLYCYIMARSWQLWRGADSQFLEVIHKARFALSVGVICAIAGSMHGHIEFWGREVNIRVIISQLAALAFLIGGILVIKQRDFKIRALNRGDD